MSLVRIICLKMYHPTMRSPLPHAVLLRSDIPSFLASQGLRLAHDWELPDHLSSREIVTAEGHSYSRVYHPLLPHAVVAVDTS